MDDITRWYHSESVAAWGTERPSLEDTHLHAKHLRTLTSGRDGYREHKKKKHDHTDDADDDGGAPLRCQPHMGGGVSAAGHNSAGILSELESIKGPAMAGLVDAHTAGQQQRISVSALLDSGPFGPAAARRLSQGLDGLALPHQRLSLYAMGSDVLDFLGDGCLGDLDAFLAANSTEQQQQQQFPGLPRISDALGEMAAPAGRPCGARFGGFGGDHWSSAAMAAAAFNASADATAAAAATCHQHGMPAVGGSRPPAAPGRAPGGFGLYLASPRGNSNASGGLHVAAAAAGPVGAMVSGPGGAGGFDAAAADGSGSGRKRGRRSASHVQGGLALDVGGVKRPRVSGLLMDMDTPKVRAMAANAGIAALTPRSPAVTPSGIAAAARALVAARAAQQAAGNTAAMPGLNKQQQQTGSAAAGAPAAAAGSEYGTTEALQRPASGKYKCVLDLSTPKTTEQQQQQHVALPVPAFQQLFGGKRLPGCSGAAAATTTAAAAASPDAQEKDTADPEAAAATAGCAAASPAAAFPGDADGKRSWVLNLGDEPTPTGLKGGAVTAAGSSAQPVAAASCSSGAAAAVPAARKTAVGFLPALADIERMI
ncbi:hypothetical protein OEZ86_008003 [Tetradesmus obliquus]|nr:hypothetical protein OEZ86_008003 [Tetradesmus obliquus]